MEKTGLSPHGRTVASISTRCTRTTTGPGSMTMIWMSGVQRKSFNDGAGQLTGSQRRAVKEKSFAILAP
jgi:hypothetical protein